MKFQHCAKGTFEPAKYLSGNAESCKNCGKLSIFQQLRFYVKSHLTEFKWSKIAILRVLEALTWKVLENFTLENSKNFQMVITAVFEFVKST